MLSPLSLCCSPNPLLTISTSLTPLNPNPNPRLTISFPLHCSTTVTTASTSSTSTASPAASPPAPAKRRRQRQRFFPGENEGICEEMRFVAMRLRDEKADAEVRDDGSAWQPSIEGFLKYLVDSKLVFETVERIVNESSDAAYVNFKNNKLERTESLVKDLEWFKEQGHDIPEPSLPGRRYSTYLTELAASSTPSFLCHYYNLYFAHATGGVGIGQKVCQKLLEGQELEFYKWDGDVQMLLKDAREPLNNLGKQWSRDEKNKCLKEASKAFRFLGQIIRHILRNPSWWSPGFPASNQ